MRAHDKSAFVTFFIEFRIKTATPDFLSNSAVNEFLIKEYEI